MKSGRYIILLFTFLFLAITVSRAVGNYKFRTMSPDGGFYYDGVKAIEQDSEGFVWVMLDYELYRFDGFSYKRYYPAFSSLDPARKWIFQNMASDSSGRLFVNTDNGLYAYNRIADDFTKISGRVSTVRVDNRDNVWVWKDRVWSRLDTSTGVISSPLPDESGVLTFNSVFCMYNQDLYFFSDRSIYRYNYAGNHLQLCLSLPGDGVDVRFAQAHNGKMWIYLDTYGLYKIDLSSFQVEDHYELPTARIAHSLRSFYVDKMGYIWFGTLEGLFVFDPESGRYRHYEQTENDAFGIPNNSIWTISDDRQQNVWLGMYTGALSYVNIDEGNAMTTYLPQTSGLNQTPVSTFAENQQYLWIGTEGGGINRMEKATGEFVQFTVSDGIASNNVKSLLTDARGNLWVAMYMGGMACCETATGRVSSFRHEPGNDNSLLCDDVRKIVHEGDSGLWLAYQHYLPLVSYFSFHDQSFKHFVLDEVEGDGYIFDIMRQGEKYLWAISNDKLYRLDINSGEVDAITPDDSRYMGLYTLCPDDSGNIWIGTIGHGLMKYDTRESRFVYPEELLQHNPYSIYSICYAAGHLWMGTDNGLYRYNMEEKKLLKFDKGEGTQGQVYYPLSVLKGRDGKLYFGGTSGFTVIDPDKITHNTHQPRAIISDFFIDHVSARPEFDSGDSIPEIVLGYDQANFGFLFSSDNYHIPGENFFRHRLRGYDDRWIETDAANRTAMYSKVPAGTYYFEVFAANNDGIWGDKPQVVKVVRRPAPWFSWPAYVLCFVILSGVGLMIIRYYNDKKRLKMRLYLEQLEREKKEEIHQSQLVFFTNISHDFRTPLSLIIAAVDKLRREGLKEYYYRILNGNAQRLLNLVNELMDFRTIENGKMKLELRPVRLNEFIRQISSDFIDYAAQKKISFDINCDATFPENVYADSSIVEKIVMNLLNNTFKYTHAGGSVSVTTLPAGQVFQSLYASNFTVGEVENGTAYYSIVVSDTGVGISGESIANVFERFYKVKTVDADSHIGTGIGLALVKSLVLLHRGSITIYSEREQGTDMVVSLPLDTGLFDEMDYNEREPVENLSETASPTEDSDKNALAGPEYEIASAGKKKILIAEDNTDLRNLIADSLSDEYDVVQAADGLEALKLIGETDFDLIISDIMMPHKDGVSLCNDVKGDINTSHIPFILLTAKTGMESKIEGVGSGADLYFEKPVDLQYLKLSLRNIFHNQQKLRDYYSRNYFADSSELSTNEQDARFLKNLNSIIGSNLDKPELDVNRIASELSMSRSKLYTKVKGLTGKSVVEYVLNYRLRQAARLIIEENMTMREVMMRIGIESQPYFTSSFKKVFGETPTAFARKHKA